MRETRRGERNNAPPPGFFSSRARLRYDTRPRRFSPSSGRRRRPSPCTPKKMAGRRTAAHAATLAWLFFRMGREVFVSGKQSRTERSAPAASGNVGSPRAVRKGWGPDAVVVLTGHPARRTLVRLGGGGRGARRGLVLGLRGVVRLALRLGRCRAGSSAPCRRCWRPGLCRWVYGGGPGASFPKKGPGPSASPGSLGERRAGRALVTRPRKTG